MAVSANYLAYVLEQLARLGEVRSRRMFGGAGLYCDGLFFGLIAADTLYLRVDDGNRARYTARGMSPFRPYPDRPEFSMTYYEVPADVLEEAEELTIWASHAVAAARVSGKPAARATRRTGRATSK